MAQTFIINTNPCMICDKGGKVEMSASQYEAYTAYRNGVGARFIQDALPELSDGEREQLITGTHDECFDKFL